MHCRAMVTGYNRGDWERLLQGTTTIHRRCRTPRI
jgi:hypothetical protein